MARFDLSRALAAQHKALGPHPAFMDASTPVATYSPGKQRERGLLSQREAGRHSDAYGGSQAIDWVYDCIGLYSDAASSAPYVLSKEDETKLVRVKTAGTPPEYELGPKALYDLLDDPNPFMQYSELISLLVIDLLLVGNAYWFKWQMNDEGRPLALYRLAPSHVKVVPGPFGPVRYEYAPPGANKPLKIAPEALIHFRRPNPHSSYYGMGVIQGAGRAMDLELAITDTMSSYFENKADPSLIVQSDRRVPRDVFNKLRAQLRARAAGTRNAGEMLVLESGLKASSLSTSARDALFYELSKMSRDRVFVKFRASPILFGLMDESSSSNKVADLRREFDNSTLRPFTGRLSEQITNGLARAYGVKYTIDHRVVLPPEEAIKVADSIAKMPGVKIREIRKQYAQFGIEESTGNADIDNLIVNLPGENMDEDGQGVNGGDGLADQPIGGEAGRPPKMANTAAIGSGKPGGGVAQGKALADVLGALEAKATNAAGERVTIGNHLPDEKAPADVYARARAADINAATKYVREGLQDAAVELEKDLLEHVEGKALKTSDLVSRIRQSGAWKKFRENVTAVLEEGARRAASSGVMHSGLTPEDDVDYDELVKSVVHRPEGLGSIIRTIRERVVKRVKEERDGNAERHEYDTAVREVVRDWGRSQADLIAETEAVHAYNEATLTVAELSGVKNVFVTDGDDHDEPCQEANNSIWDIPTARANRLQHPRCRRAFLPLTAGEVS